MEMDKNQRLEAYKKYGVRIGTKQINNQMNKFIFRRIPGKFTIFNVKAIDERIRLVAKFLSGYKRKDILLVCTLDSAYYAVYNFAKLMKVSVNFGRYLAGSLTNLNYKDFFESKVLFVTDPSTNRRAINDAKKVRIPVVGICNTDNKLSYIDIVIPGNNKNGNSIGFILYLIAYEMGTKKEKEALSKITIDDFLTKELEF